MLLLSGVAAAVGSPSDAVAQQAPEQLAVLSHPEVRNSPVVARGDYLVLIDLDENQLHFMQGRNILWSATVGTGMDLRLDSGDRKWEFSTPVGEYEVKFKEEDPVWIAPDWFYIENKRPVPPPNDPRRRFPGSLGVAAVYIGAGLAIHGTDKPDLLGQRISHGCIRMANHYAQRLYHNVQVGTKVLIVGTQEKREVGRLIPGNVPGAGPVDARTQRVRDRAKADRERMIRQLNGLDNEALVARLEEELEESPAADAVAKWAESASVLVRRAVKDGDFEAARGLLGIVETIDEQRVRAEYLTFLADLYSRGSQTAAQGLARLEPAAQRAAAGAIVEATLALFAPGAETPTAPWPSRRILRAALAEEDAQPGWEAIQDAERSFRARSREAPGAPAVTTGRSGRL
jgi:lipoprotein-anchoring transpeptidase ErfK/SrfK